MLIFGIDKFMSECRALVNFIGNAVATLFVAKWNHELDVVRARAVFAGKDVEPLFDPSEDLDVNPYDPADHELVRANHGQLAMAGAAAPTVGDGLGSAGAQRIRVTTGLAPSVTPPTATSRQPLQSQEKEHP